jgi:tetratricopeptide (TPR) repeat protein
MEITAVAFCEPRNCPGAADWICATLERSQFHFGNFQPLWKEGMHKNLAPRTLSEDRQIAPSHLCYQTSTRSVFEIDGFGRLTHPGSQNIFQALLAEPPERIDSTMAQRKIRRKPQASAPQTADSKSEVSFDWKTVLLPLGLCLVCVLAYANSFSSGFVADNHYIIQEDPRIRAVTSENVGMIINHGYWFLPPEKGLYRPFTTLTYLFNYAILGNGDQPGGYHAVNLLIHLLNVIFVYVLALRFLRNMWQAFFVAALWGVHPVSTEAVTNIVGRADLLAALGVLCGFWMYLKSVETSGSRHWSWLAGLMVVTTIGVFSKESGVVILGLIVLYEIAFWTERHNIRGMLLGCAATALPILLMLVQRARVFAKSDAPVFPYVENPLIGSGFRVAKLTAVKVLAKYLWLLVWPAKLSWNYYYSQIPLSRGTLQDWIAWIAIAAVAVAVLYLFRRNPPAFFFSAFAFVAIAPVSNLAIPIGTIMAERFLYLPAIGFAACAVMAIAAIGEKSQSRSGAMALLCLIVLIFAVRTWARNSDWHDNLSLMRAGVEAAPNSYANHQFLATEMYLADPSHSNIYEVIEEGDKSLAILNPLPDSLNIAEPYASAGTYYERKGDLHMQTDPNGMRTVAPESMPSYQKALEILERGERIDRLADAQNIAREQARGKADSEIAHTGSVALYQELALTYLRLGDNQKALDAANYARTLAPSLPETYLLIANINFEGNRIEDGVGTMVQAYLITGSPGVIQSLDQMFKVGMDPQGCAIAKGANGPYLNNACAPVHTIICKASANLIKTYAEARQPEQAAAARNRALSEFACSEETLR